ncbi:alpha-1,6-mannosylglycoprotein 6-beta-N-acetylglucosaminyltransferase A-like isoform X2 [Actinia tenebrosa]|uniref:alpha-1,6-mannosyl-glycoprotein 6-beta-N-acetylglucosaminyltransferase n=1 Tax=Actinia tenebrosa TaxID=6105 RepID=A0A6P8H2R9_ACTTE|nr:alpha-1,6-mannosylglycoprotein 6-beta-N-acetylglucosaminyltransferase A-like isoform X2 [Actinia tenebrosa]
MILKVKKICLRFWKVAALLSALGTVVFFLKNEDMSLRNEPCPTYGRKETRKVYAEKISNTQDNKSPNSTFLPVTEDETKRRDCSVPIDDAFPLCKVKFKEFKQTWNEYCHGKKFKVNINDPCSILVYLSEVEPWCPRLPWRQNGIIPSVEPPKISGLQTDIKGLLELLDDKDFDWIRMRAQSSWSQWVNAAKGLEKKENLGGRKRQRIVVYLAAVGHNTFILDAAFKGGPLGELVQWADVICSLYILGHDLIVSTRHQRFKNGEILSKHQNGCALKEVAAVDRIFSDITGYRVLGWELGPTFPSYGCKFLMLDSFGTEAEFNYAFYKPQLRRSAWGNLNAKLKQFMTMFPHSPDNLFLGFAVPMKSRPVRLDQPEPEKKPKALIYGKDHNYYRGKRKYLDILNKYVELHCTIPLEDKNIRSTVPEYVINHGIVNNTELVRILQESKVFVGLGFPFEGPAPLDAVANGCFYINPKINPPHNRDNNAFYGGKPTARKITSQNPYAEDFIGKPYVYTIDMNNDTEVENTIKEILASKEVPHLPFEFTHEGMLQRVNAFLENLDFCTSGHQWPPKSEMKVLIGQLGKSCRDVCFEKGLLCEPAFFHFLNNIKELKRSGFSCKEYNKEESIYAPSFNTTDKSCVLQDMPLLYSCVSEAKDTARLCPCRTYQKEQVALYK